MLEKSTFYKELAPRSRTYELRGQGGKKRNVQNQDKQTPHTVLQKLTVTHPLELIIDFFQLRHEATFFLELTSPVYVWQEDPSLSPLEKLILHR